MPYYLTKVSFQATCLLTGTPEAQGDTWESVSMLTGTRLRVSLTYYSGSSIQSEDKIGFSQILIYYLELTP